MFVSVMVLGEFATSAALIGPQGEPARQYLVTQAGSLKWALASSSASSSRDYGSCNRGLLRVVDLKKSL